MSILRKADFYYGAMLSCHINNGLAPMIIEPGDSRRIYSLTTNNDDYKIYAKYVSKPLKRQKEDAKLWQFIFSRDEIEFIKDYKKMRKNFILPLFVGKKIYKIVRLLYYLLKKQKIVWTFIMKGIVIGLLLNEKKGYMV